MSVRASDLATLSVVARRAAVLIHELKVSNGSQEFQMGQAAKAIAQLSSALATAKEDAYDADDLSAIAGVLSPAPPPPAADPNAGTPANQSTGTTANRSTGSAAVAAPTFKTTGGILTDAAGRTVYAHSGTDTPDPTQWPAAGTYTPAGGPAQPVYYYAGDTVPGSTAGNLPANGWTTITPPAGS